MPPEDEPHCLGFEFVHDQLAISNIVTERHWATHPHALLLGRGDLVADALAGNLALELREREQDVERQSSHAGGSVERLRNADERRTARIQYLDDLGEIGEAAGQPVNLRWFRLPGQFGG